MGKNINKYRGEGRSIKDTKYLRPDPAKMEAAGWVRPAGDNPPPAGPEPPEHTIPAQEHTAPAHGQQKLHVPEETAASAGSGGVGSSGSPGLPDRARGCHKEEEGETSYGRFVFKGGMIALIVDHGPNPGPHSIFQSFQPHVISCGWNTLSSRETPAETDGNCLIYVTGIYGCLVLPLPRTRNL